MQLLPPASGGLEGETQICPDLLDLHLQWRGGQQEMLPTRGAEMKREKKCIYWHPLYSHPCVDGKPMSHRAGQICLNPEFRSRAILMTKNCCCELRETKRPKYARVVGA